MKIGDLVRVHGGLHSTAPIALVIDHIPINHVVKYERFIIIWLSGPRLGKKNLEPAHTLEKVLS